MPKAPRRATPKSEWNFVHKIYDTHHDEATQKRLQAEFDAHFDLIDPQLFKDIAAYQEKVKQARIKACPVGYEAIVDERYGEVHYLPLDSYIDEHGLLNPRMDEQVEDFCVKEWPGPKASVDMSQFPEPPLYHPRTFF